MTPDSNAMSTSSQKFAQFKQKKRQEGKTDLISPEHDMKEEHGKYELFVIFCHSNWHIIVFCYITSQQTAIIMKNERTLKN